MLMTVVSFPAFHGSFSSIVSEDSEHFYVSQSFMLKGYLVTLVMKVFGPLLLVQYHIYRMR